MFGGIGVAAVDGQIWSAVGYLNDLWLLTIPANGEPIRWHWLSGTNSPGNPGVYEPGIAQSTCSSPEAVPGARAGHKTVMQATATGHVLWLFGGRGIDG
eukprot:COSAG02_NODE_45116_length_360_cov_0.647510_1_plen_98_part_10